MLRHGFQAHIIPGASLSDIKPHSPAYVHLWNQDKVRCSRAMEKLRNSTRLEVITKPSLIFPLLPAYRGKHVWRFKQFGIDYKLRLTSDISSSGDNDI